ncbi:cytoplasmic dynein 2 light intermediate chain 1 isoform X1 [Rhopalosiphum padi]|uniref:cytoplasmic dynein 2 light intermediate chain 1 isoform X1 n=1 Tax=Rhopalosiphum padi TaxID=40932 RepID=UPI00298DE68B|nr:cytoplasmic dynein 2 light intermediate chain 1 isoform X1 [Rhopalosiphum padi]
MTSTSVRNDQTILELAMSSKNVASDMVPVERTLLVIGSKNAGKTSLIYSFFDKNEKPKPTLALEYSFARRSGKSLTKDICHVWELGGGLVFKDLLSVIVQKTRGRRLSVVLVLDLSKPDVLWNTMEMLLEEVKVHLGNVLDVEEYNQINVKNIEDKKFMSPLPIPVMIVGSKYDVYQNFEPAKKRVLCQCLRYVAHTYGASLIFYGVNDTVLVKVSKEMMSHYGFGTPYPKNHIYDSNKALLVPAGTDCFEKIDNLNEAGSIRSMHKYKNTFVSAFKQISIESGTHALNTDNADPLNDTNYADPLIDETLKKKQEVCDKNISTTQCTYYYNNTMYSMTKSVFII